MGWVLLMALGAAFVVGYFVGSVFEQDCPESKKDDEDDYFLW